MRVFVAWQYLSKTEHADAQRSYSSRIFEIFSLGRNILAVCTFYERTKNSEMDIIGTSHYNISHFGRRNYRCYIFRITFICKRRWNDEAKIEFLSKENSSSHLTHYISLFNDFVRAIFPQLIEKSFLQRLAIGIKELRFSSILIRLDNVLNNVLSKFQKNYKKAYAANTLKEKYMFYFYLDLSAIIQIVANCILYIHTLSHVA